MTHRTLVGLACGLLLALSAAAGAGPVRDLGYVTQVHPQKHIVVIGGQGFVVTADTRMRGVSGGLRHLRPGTRVRFRYEASGNGRGPAPLIELEAIGYDRNMAVPD
jgi:hypothetical protein